MFIIKPVDKTKLSCITLPPPIKLAPQLLKKLTFTITLFSVSFAAVSRDSFVCADLGLDVLFCAIGNNWSFFFLFSLMESFLTQRKNPELWNKQNFHQTVLFWFLNFIQYASSLYSSLCISFWTEKENWFNNQSFLGCWSFPVFSWS